MCLYNRGRTSFRATPCGGADGNIKVVARLISAFVRDEEAAGSNPATPTR